MHIVKDSQSAQLDLESIGIKGAALRHLRSLRLYVPRFTILTSSFFADLAEKSGFASKARFAVENLSGPSEVAREFERLLAEFSVPHELSSVLDEPLRDLAGQGPLRVVARPSRPYMSKIDSEHHLNLTSKGEVLDAIVAIFKEHFSAPAITERVEKDLEIVHLQLPLILQVFVNPDVTGIIMPYRERVGFYYLTAWKGFGFELDFHTSDHYLVNYRDLMLERFLNNTSGETVFFEESSGSISRTKILHEEAKEPFLDHDQIIEMCKLYAEHASDLGGLAIEFKIKGTDVSFISLKDAGILERAERALEELRSKPPRGADPPATDAKVRDSEEEPVVVAESTESPTGPRAETEPEPQVRPPAPEPPKTPDEPARSEEARVEPEAPEPAEPIVVPEVSHGDSDENRATVSRIIGKYIEINPSLERQFRLLEQDLLEALR
ncbi:MAG: PEP/pyruvate-binding domain-containing protein [Candidatus Woesearchaeota archaeon]